VRDVFATTAVVTRRGDPSTVNCAVGARCVIRQRTANRGESKGLLVGLCVFSRDHMKIYSLDDSARAGGTISTSMSLTGSEEKDALILPRVRHP